MKLVNLRDNQMRGLDKSKIDPKRAFWGDFLYYRVYVIQGHAFNPKVIDACSYFDEPQRMIEQFPRYYLGKT
jgi:hypothetical protein